MCLKRSWVGFVEVLAVLVFHVQWWQVEYEACADLNPGPKFVGDLSPCRFASRSRSSGSV